MKRKTSLVLLSTILVLLLSVSMTGKASPPKTEFHIVLQLQNPPTQDITILNNVYIIKTVQEYDVTGTIDGSLKSVGTVTWNTQSDIAIVSGIFVITTNDGTISGTSFAMIRGFSKGPVYFEIVRNTFTGHGFMNIKGTISIVSIDEMDMDGYSW